MPALERVSIVAMLLASADGSAERIEALHGARLEMLLDRLVDTTVRGFVYEASGSVAACVLDAGSLRVRRVCERSRMPYALLDEPPDDRGEWLATALTAVQRVVSPEER